jgi:hypothetical protein
MGILDRLLQQASSQLRPGTQQMKVTGSAYDVWGQRGWPGVDIVGESFNSAAIRGFLLSLFMFPGLSGAAGR